MNKKYLAIIIVLFSLVIISFTYYSKIQEDQIINSFIADKGSCYLDDGTCLHDDRDYTTYIIGYSVGIALLILGFYTYAIDKSEDKLLKHQEDVVKELNKVKEIDAKKDEFKAFVSGFSKDEQNILKTIHSQEGIKQSTLRFKTALSKTTLSLILKSLEERKIITRKKDGKSNRVYIVNKY